MILRRFQPRAYSSSLTVSAVPIRSSLLRPGNSVRAVHLDHRVRLRNSYVPSGAVTIKNRKDDEDGHAKLVRAGFLRQANSGIFHMLPLGFRVQEKIKALIDKHMQSIGASRLSLSTISSQALWQKSGRYEKIGSELFQFVDRKDAHFLLSPTHEEEITSLVKQTVFSHKSLPLRLYQITRKYRDEFRPRKGLLRSREFVMKDLYTFDTSVSNALETYSQVRAAYDKLFSELRLPVMVAEASSGDIGGDLSHEYHLPTQEGEDDVVKCSSCGYVANSEVAESRTCQPQTSESADSSSASLRIWRGISKDRLTLVNVWYSEAGKPGVDSRDVDMNIHAIKRLVPDIDASVEKVNNDWWAALYPGDQDNAPTPKDAVKTSPRLVNLIDCSAAGLGIQSRLEDDLKSSLLPFSEEKSGLLTVPSPEFVSQNSVGDQLNLLKIRNGDACPKCDSGTLSIEKAIELGHTFHLGDKYSEPMGATVAIPSSKESGQPGTKVPMQMGCHGIGVSRIIGAVAEFLADEKGLNWPRVIAPHEVVIVAHNDLEEEAVQVYDVLAGGSSPGSPQSTQSTLDLLLDDRDRSLPWKMKDADLVGYPVMVVVGNEWSKTRRCEVQCRQLGVRQLVPFDELSSVVYNLLGQL